MNWWCTANDGPQGAFACNKDMEAEINFWTSGYNIGYGPRPADQAWYAEKVPQGDETVPVQQKGGDVEVQVVWYELD